MAPVKKKAADKLRKQKKECEQKRRDKIKSDPHLYEEAKRKERERYKKRKEEGKIKKIADLLPREKKAQRKKWVEKTAKSRLKKKQEENSKNFHPETPPEGDEEIQSEEVVVPNQQQLVVGRAGTSREESGKKVAKRNKAKAYREIDRLKKELEIERKDNRKLVKSKEKYKKRLYRLKQKNKNLKSPKQKVNEILQGERVSPRVKRFLEFSTALTSQIEENYKKNKSSRKCKKVFGLVLSGKIVKKYRSMHKVPVQGYWKKLKKINDSDSLKDMLKNKDIANYKTKNQLRTKKDVTMFFEQDDVSRLEPGVKDTITRNKVKKQVRTLMGNLKVLHKKFEAENGYDIPYSSFCFFRPFWVLKPDVKKRDTCACEKHENISLVFEKLKILKVIKYSDMDEMVKSLCCKDLAKEPEKCLERKCLKCFHLQVKIETFENNMICIQQWLRKDVKYFLKGEEKITKKVVKETLEIETKSLVEMFLDMVPPFMQHICNIMHQYRTVKDLKSSLKPDDVLIHVDFSQNYECKYAKEIQSVHFGGSRQQITLHTGVIYYKNNDDDNVHCLSFSSLSESLRHDSSAIAAHLSCILHHAKSLKGNLKTIHFLSDSPTTQYRNKSMFYLILNYLTNYCSESITWNYSECGHGKGAPDGIGGYLKRTANHTVAEGTDIATFDVFYDLLSKRCKKVKLFLVKKEEIEDIDAILMKNIPTFKGTMKVRQVVWKSQGKNLEMRRLSCSICGTERCPHYFIGTFTPQPTEQPKFSGASSSNRLRFKEVYSDSCSEEEVVNTEASIVSTYARAEEDRSCTKNEQSDAKANDFVLVKLWGKKNVKHYVAVVNSVSEHDCEVKFMKRVNLKHQFIFPQNDDISMVPLTDVVHVLKPPTVDNREHYYFNLEKFKNMTIE